MALSLARITLYAALGNFSLTRPLAWRWRRRIFTLLLGDLAGQGAEPARTRQDAMVRLYLAYHTALFELLYGMTHDREWSADLLQETFLRAYTAKQDLVALEFPKAWLYRIATNVALQAIQRRRRFGLVSISDLAAPDAANLPLPEVPMPEALVTEDFTASVAERDAVWGVLLALPPRWRAVLLLQCVADLSVADICQQLRLSEANVRKLLFRAKERYRRLYAAAESTGGQAS